MARTYASYLGLLALSVILLRSAFRGWSLEESVVAGVLAGVGLAGVGFIVGSLAESLVADSVRWQFQHAMQEFAEKNKGSGK